MHPKFHVRQSIRLAMNDKRLVVTIVGDSILYNDVAQSQNVVKRSC
jgi:hypothetical protein